MLEAFQPRTKHYVLTVVADSICLFVVVIVSVFVVMKLFKFLIVSVN